MERVIDWEPTPEQELNWAIHNDHADGNDPEQEDFPFIQETECPECGSPDIDVHFRYDFQCHECGCAFDEEES